MEICALKFLFSNFPHLEKEVWYWAGSLKWFCSPAISNVGRTVQKCQLCETQPVGTAWLWKAFLKYWDAFWQPQPNLVEHTINLLLLHLLLIMKNEDNLNSFFFPSCEEFSCSFNRKEEAKFSVPAQAKFTQRLT